MALLTAVGCGENVDGRVDGGGAEVARPLVDVPPLDGRDSADVPAIDTTCVATDAPDLPDVQLSPTADAADTPVTTADLAVESIAPNPVDSAMDEASEVAAVDAQTEAGVGCLIDGTLYPAGARKPDNGCKYCFPWWWTTAWSDLPDRTPCGTTDQVCSTGYCGYCMPGDHKCQDASTYLLCKASRTWLVMGRCQNGCNADAGTCNP